MSCVFGENRDIFFPKLSVQLYFIKFSEIAVKYLKEKGLEPILCETEDEARKLMEIIKTKDSKNAINLNLNLNNRWPFLFTISDTTGEKGYEEFYTDNETLDMNRFKNLGIIKNKPENFDDPLIISCIVSG